MNTKRTILILGAGGKVAKSVIELLNEETSWDIHAVSSKPLDESFNQCERVTGHQIDPMDFIEVRKLAKRIEPSVIVNGVALTDVNLCESNKQLAWDLNVRYVENVLRMSRIVNANVIHYSTDYIFDGKEGPYTENDRPNPLNYYGKSKLAAENILQSSIDTVAIIRTNVVYGVVPGVKTDFVQWVYNQCIEGNTIHVVNDQYGNPTLSDDIALATMRLIEKKRCGVYHVGGSDYISRYEFAMKIAQMFMVDPTYITPISTSDLKQEALRPLKSGLVTLKTEADLMITFAGIESGLQTYRHKAASCDARLKNVPQNIFTSSSLKNK